MDAQLKVWARTLIFQARIAYNQGISHKQYLQHVDKLNMRHCSLKILRQSLRKKKHFYRYWPSNKGQLTPFNHFNLHINRIYMFSSWFCAKYVQERSVGVELTLGSVLCLFSNVAIHSISKVGIKLTYLHGQGVVPEN